MQLAACSAKERIGHVIDVTTTGAHSVRATAELYQSVIMGIADGVILGNAEQILTLNETAERILGAKPGDSVKDVRASLRISDESGRALPDEELPYAKALATGAPQGPVLVRVERAGEHPKWLLTRSTPVTYRGAAAVVTTFTDVTTLRGAQSELSRERARFDVIFESMTEAVVACDDTGTINYINGAARRMLPIRVGERLQGWTERYLFLRADGDTLEVHERPLYRALHGEEVEEPDLILATSDGPVVHVSVNARPLRDPTTGTRMGAVAVLRDTTAVVAAQKQLRDADERLRHSQKMEAIGQLAGGIAHDFNNLLSAIMSYSQLALESLDKRSAAAEDIRQVLDASGRARGLTKQLLAFSRQQVLQMREVNVNSVVSDVQKLLSRVIGANVELVVRTADDVAAVEADPTQIEQVLINLVVNARDAISGRGVVVIETRNVTLDSAAAAQLGDITPGDYVVITVSDTGSGMDEATRKRAFDPFFTTKAAGKGTGLGLATVYGIVRQTRGNIALYSEPGVGTTVKIYLPSIAPLAPARRLTPPRGTVVGNETILLVDDEPQVRTAIRRILESRGYTVVEAENGREALALLEVHIGPIDLVVTDLVMPTMNGRELLERLRQDRPSIPVLLISGYTAETVDRQGSRESSVHFLEKPFTTASLAKAVRAAIDGRAEERVA